MKTLFTALLSLAAIFSLPTRAASAAVPADLPETCYLFSYFYHDREADGLRLAWSRDGFKWQTINGGESTLRPMVGENKLMRDPALYRGPDGTFHAVWTTGWTGKTIGYASSKDLITWSEQRALPVMAHEKDAQNCWAPELVWDDAKQHYLIHWSTTILGKFPETANSNRGPHRNHRIYGTTTKDFVTFTPTKLIYDGGYNVIDANFEKNGNEWLMFVKNETLTPKTEKNIRLVRGPSLEGPWGEASAPITGDYWAEGPSVLKVGNEWRVYFDKHMLNAIGLVTSRDLKTWTDVSDRVSFPADARHGTVLAVPRAVLANLLANEDRLRQPVLRSAIANADATYPECHASTLVEVAPGRLVGAWFGGTRERNPDVGIWVAHYENNKWGTAVEVANGIQADGSPRMPTWNPVLFQAPQGGPLFLFYKVGPSPSRWWGEVKTSTDAGKTWSVARRLPEGILGPVKNKPIVLADGTWLSGSSTEGNPEGWLVHFELSRDAGKTWEKVGPVKQGPHFEGIQPSLLQYKDGSVQAVGRSKQGVVFQTWSKDNGKTWSPLTATDLPNPNSGTDAVTLADGRQLLVYNHSGHRANEPKGDRFPLDVALSTDGITWKRVLTLETEPVVSGYAYPAVIQTSDGKVHITYTHARKRIKHVILDPARL